jgi:hypothetical protein
MRVDWCRHVIPWASKRSPQGETIVKERQPYDTDCHGSREQTLRVIGIDAHRSTGDG